MSREIAKAQRDLAEMLDAIKRDFREYLEVGRFKAVRVLSNGVRVTVELKIPKLKPKVQDGLWHVSPGKWDSR